MVDRRVRYLLIFGLAVAVGAAGVNALPATPERTGKPPVILVVLESTRADHVGPCYGYDRETAPNLCTLAHDGVLFERTYSQGPRTQTAMPSLLASQWPSSVGIPKWGYRLSPDSSLLAERLRSSGYLTAANEVSSLANGGMLQGVIRRFSLEGRVGEVYGHSGSSSPALETGMELFNTQRRFFLMHMYRRFGHKPYDPPAPHDLWRNDSDRPGTVNRYDGEIRAADARIGTVVETLKERGVYDEALVVVTADHGELVSRGGHYAPPREGLTHVPLVIKFPDNRWAGRTVAERVRHVDIVPTILEIAGITPEPGPVGRSLIPLVRHGGEDRPSVAGLYPDRHWELRADGLVYRLENVRDSCLGTAPANHTLVTAGGGDGPEELAADRPDVTRRMREMLCERYISGVETSPPLPPPNS